MMTEAYLEKNNIIFNFFKFLFKFFICFCLFNTIFILQKDVFSFKNIRNNNCNNNNYLNINKFKNKYKLNYFYNYSFSFKFNISKIEYNIVFYDNSNKLILPSDMTLYNDLHIVCYINDENNKSYIKSLAEISENKYFSCIEFINLNETVNFGIEIFNNEISYIIYFNLISINYNNLNYLSDYYADPLIINNNYKLLINKINMSKYLIKKSFISPPIFSTKKNLNIKYNKWFFINLFNYYFCFCKGINCSYKKIVQKYKYNFYLNIIDKNRYIYNKTDYLFADFIKKFYSTDDTYPVFTEMIRLNLSAHYMTEDFNLYKFHCRGIRNCLSILLVDKNNRTINGDFLEKHLTLFLKLKAAISGAIFFYIDNLFYNIDYITHICVGHGVSIIKDFLYAPHSYYGSNSYNKILLPPSDKIIAIAKKRGWKEDNIIKINLPRWDKYSHHYYNQYYLKKNEEINKNSIYIMFTWRQLKTNKTISKYYISNILKLIGNKKLIKILKEKNITLYFTIHHKLQNYINIFKKNNEFIKYIVENRISACLSKAKLLITDFSSIIFDFICMKKPYILYIPDAYDPQIENIYVKNYFKIIKSLKYNLFHFKNIFLDVNETINKIIYYINNNFNLEQILKDYYNEFSFKSGNNIKEFIKYLIKLN